jgi:hypothetical protein
MLVYEASPVGVGHEVFGDGGVDEVSDLDKLGERFFELVDLACCCNVGFFESD